MIQAVWQLLIYRHKQCLKHPITKLVSALVNYKDLEIKINPVSEIPILIYQNKGYIKLLNDWDNLNFFTATLFILFLFGIGGHLTKKDTLRRIYISLQS